MKKDKQKEKLKQLLITEREKNKGYEQLAQLHSAYITILLHRLSATEANPISISTEDVKIAMNDFETRAYTTETGVWNLYFEKVKKD